MEQKINHQLVVIDSLLKSSEFSLAIAKSQDTAYYTALRQPVPQFIPTGQDSAVIIKPGREQKIATGLAGFYAVECGIGLLCEQSKQKPTDWLRKIADNTIDTATILLLNRFANATWKAGQPFRGLQRITRPVFTGAGFLPQAEVKKDEQQVQKAAEKLLSSLSAVADSSADQQFQKIRMLLHSLPYAAEVAAVIDNSYTAKHGAAANPDSGDFRITEKDEKIATNVAGFYALECCTNYIVTTRNVLPSDLLQSIVDNSISKEDKRLFCRFANATWKAGQPFRDLNRITRETFTPFYFLSDADIEKDWVQIYAAAKKLLKEL